jgi:hypothetical protein
MGQSGDENVLRQPRNMNFARADNSSAAIAEGITEAKD